MKMLFETLKPEVQARMSPDLVRRLVAVDEHDYCGVRRKVREDKAKNGENVSEEWLDQGILALKQYYAIALIDGCNMHAVSGPVDEFWHAHILHTRDYNDFCQKIAGRYLQHEPLDHAQVKDVDFVNRLYTYTMKRYDDCFTHFDAGLHPQDPEFAELVCLHGDDAAAEVYALYPMDQALSPAGTSFAAI